MKNACSPLLLLLLGACATTSSQETYAVSSAPSQRVGLYLGQRNLPDSDWDPVDEQTLIGVEYADENPGAPVGWELALFRSEDDDDIGGLDVKASTTELSGGVRKSFGAEDSKLHPYVGGGLSYIQAKADVDVFGDDDDSSLAGYIHGGILFDVTGSFYLGLDLRFLFGSDVEIFGESGDVDYEQYAIVVGFAF